MKRFLAFAAILFWLATASSVRADVVYTNETDFLAALGASPGFLNDFSDLTESDQFVHPLNYSSNTFAYSITTLPPLYLLSITGALSTVNPTDDILVTFTSGNVRAAGGWCYLVDSDAAPVTGSVSATFSNSAQVTVTNDGAAPTSFIGFISSSTAITSLTIHGATTGAYPALDHFYVAEAAAALIARRVSVNTLLLAWPAPIGGYDLQSSSQPRGAQWTNVPVVPEQVGDQMQVTVPVSTGRMFFRLQKQ